MDHLRWHLEQVPIEHDQISEFAYLDGAGLRFLESQVGAVDRVCRDSRLQIQGFIGDPTGSWFLVQTSRR